MNSFLFTAFVQSCASTLNLSPQEIQKRLERTHLVKGMTLEKTTFFPYTREEIVTLFVEELTTTQGIWEVWALLMSVDLLTVEDAYSNTLLKHYVCGHDVLATILGATRIVLDKIYFREVHTEVIELREKLVQLLRKNRR